jgi:tetratricopeptide (TPR) repeat protein
VKSSTPAAAAMSARPGRPGFVRAARLLAPLLGVLGLVVACSSSGTGPSGTAGPARRREEFPLDPREELTGPFPDGVETGWLALVAGRPADAEAEFLRARTSRPYLAAEIGLIEVRILLGRNSEALAACRETLAAGGPQTVPLLVACGEARARAGQIFEAHELYARAAAKTGSRSEIRKRAEDLKSQAIEVLAKSASAGARDRNYSDARRRAERAIALAPGDAALHALAGEIELEDGQPDKAFERFREAYRLDPTNVAVQEKLAELARDRDPSLSVSILDALARRDPRYADRAAEARLAFRISNWPEPEREAAQAERLSRAGAASLVWWMFPEIREARVKSSVIASDIVSRKDSRAMTRAISLGLIDVDSETHRARPDAGLTRRSGARMVLRLLKIMRAGPAPDCLEGSPDSGRSGVEAVEAAIKCGLLEESESTWVSGREFTRGLDRIRVLATGKGGAG